MHYVIHMYVLQTAHLCFDKKAFVFTTDFINGIALLFGIAPKSNKKVGVLSSIFSTHQVSLFCLISAFKFLSVATATQKNFALLSDKITSTYPSEYACQDTGEIKSYPWCSGNV